MGIPNLLALQLHFSLSSMKKEATEKTSWLTGEWKLGGKNKGHRVVRQSGRVNRSGLVTDLATVSVSMTNGSTVVPCYSRERYILRPRVNA